MSHPPSRKDRLWSDVGIIIVSIFVAVKLVESGILERFLAGGSGLQLLESFIAGMFFTSAFTTAPAIAALGTIAANGSVLSTAICGAAGAVLVDLLIFHFVKNSVRSDFLALASKERRASLRHLFRGKIFRWFTPLAAALIIASPLPDELGVALVGLTGTRAKWFIPFSYAANFAGILAIGFVAKAIGS
jgi:hypothetical protein